MLAVKTKFCFSLCAGNSLFLGKDPKGKGGSVWMQAKAVQMADTSSQLCSSNATPKKITISNTAKEVLVGILEDTGSKKLCILCHGFRSNKDASTLHTLALTLAEEGLSTFRFDFSGNGESEGEFSYGNYWKEVEDIFSVISYWKVEGRQVSMLVGHSKGGNAVLLYASKHGDVPIVVNISGRFFLERGIVERLGEKFFQEIQQHGFLIVRDRSGKGDYYVTKDSLQDRLSTDMKTSCLRISKSCRVLTVHGSHDAIVPVADAYEFDKVIPSHQLNIVDEADHSFKFHKNELREAVLQFIKQSGL